jgi:phage FluMu protein Com
MAAVVQAKCPQCQKVLRIPADWLKQTMRCKHCGQTFQPRKANEAVRAAP